jgi:hypothetical protein
MSGMEIPVPAGPTTVFTDGLGDRLVDEKDGTAGREALRLTLELSGRPEFEQALRERLTRLAKWRHEGFASLGGVERREGDKHVYVLGERVAGTRLSTLLTNAATHATPVPLDAALCILRQLVPALQALHEVLSTAGHGAVAAERIVITAAGQAVLVEQALGAALERLQYSRDRYWRDLRVALPQTVGLSRFDARTDITGLGVVALSLFLGRPLRAEEYPAQIQGLVNSAEAVADGGESAPLGSALRDWLVRTLQFDPRRSFSTMAEVKAGLEAAVGYADPVAEPRALEALLAKCASAVAGVSEAPGASAGRSGAASEAFVPPAAAPGGAPAATPSDAPAQNVAAARAASLAATLELPVVPVATGESTADPLMASSLGDQPEPRETAPVIAWSRSGMIAAAVALIALTLGATMIGRGVFAPAAGIATGTLVVGTNPQGVAVLIDGKNSGATPLTVQLAPGAHVLELVTETEHRRTTINITPGAQVSQFLELPKTTATLGNLQVRTEPSRAKVTVDGHLFGQSPITVKGLAPGLHQVLLENEAGTVTEQVTIERGTTAALLVPMARPEGSFASGWIAVEAPADLQVLEDGRLVGSSRSDKIMIGVGRHQLELVNEALGIRAMRTVQVAAGQTVTVRPDWPAGTVAVNAVPWAEVSINGERVGETPIGRVSLPAGVHELVFRHPELGEKRVSATVTAGGSSKVSVDLRK